MFKKNLGQRIRDLFSGRKPDEEFFEHLEDLLIEGDLGTAQTMKIVDALREQTAKENLKNKEELVAALKAILIGSVRAHIPEIAQDRLNIVLVLGVNGVGKTTTIAKLADFYGKKLSKEAVMLSAADTFRAAAIDQLKLHGERIGVRVISQEHGADPGAVLYDSIVSAKAKNVKLILADTAGRMHNKANLVRELQKIDKIILNRAPEAHYETLLVLDATTGQNAYRQAELFSEAVSIRSAVLAKYDSTAKGGIAVAISSGLGIPFSFLGTGEKYGDIAYFDPRSYVETLLDGA